MMHHSLIANFLLLDFCHERNFSLIYNLEESHERISASKLNDD